MNFSRLAKLIRQSKRVYVIGNGGSAANASHMVNDLIARGVKAYALTDPAIISMLANDYGYAEIFARQIAVYGEEEDLLIALSGSGKSRNILEAISTAQALNMQVCGVFGDFGAPVDEWTINAGKDMQKAEEEQLHLCHYLWRVLG
mgnify:CR=1 FL=1